MTNYEAVKEWRKKNPDKVAAQARRRRAKVPEKYREASLRWYYNHLEEARMKGAEYQRKRRADPEGQRKRMQRYKIRQEAKRVEVAGRPRPDECELCGKAGSTVFDHDHVSGEFRGWICDRCNKVLGLIYDNSVLLELMVDYLRRDHGNVELQAAGGAV